MKAIFQILVVGTLAFAPREAIAQYIDMRISFKVICNTNGVRPSGITDDRLRDLADQANVWLASYQRGYRFQVVEITNIYGADLSANSPSIWYLQEIRDHLDTLDALGKSDPRYRWRTDAINIYVAQPFYTAAQAPCWGGGRSHVPSVDTGKATTALHITDEGWDLIHELGHHFDLYHTQDGVTVDANCNATLFETNKSDLVADTIWDVPCSDSSNVIAQINYGQNYLSLPAGQRKLVDDVLFNVMSYHFCTNRNTLENRLTEGQLDRWTDAAFNYHRGEVSGDTWFVDPNGGCLAPNGRSKCSPVGPGINIGGPFASVQSAAQAADPNGGDIILMRPGNYNEQITFNQPVTLRATRAGWATIGKP